jgi:hypothetical protein
MEQQASTYKDNNDKHDGFSRVIKAFCDRAKLEVDLLSQMHKKMLDECEELRKYYALDVKYSTDECIRDLFTFKQQYEVGE